MSAHRCEAVAAIVVGAGGHGAEVACYLSDLAEDGWVGSFLGFLDDLKAPGPSCCSTVLGRIDDFSLALDYSGGKTGYMVAVGQSRLRKQLAGRMESRFGATLSPWTLIHPLAFVGAHVQIGVGTLLAPGSVATTRVSLGRHVILNVKASVSHDVVIGDYGTINPGATICGNVTIHEGAYIGAGAVIKEGISVGPWSTVGAGAVVVRDIAPLSLAVGVPARVIKSLTL